MGVGRISLGAKALVVSRDPFALAASCDVYLPSPALSDAFFLSGGVNVPVTDAGLQPIVGGTIALEYYFSVGGG